MDWHRLRIGGSKLNCGQTDCVAKLTIGDNEFGRAALDFLGLTLLVDPVRLLVVDEQLGGALAAHPLVEHGLVGRLFEGLLRTRTYEIQIRGRFGYVSRDCATF